MKQELLMPMEPKEEEDVSTVTDHGDQKDKLLTANYNNIPSTNEGPVTRDFLLEVTNANYNNYNAMVMATPFNVTVSTQLELYSDPWKIKKKLTKSDLDGLSRLLIHSCLVKKHVLPFMCVDAVKQVESSDGLRVCVWDHDTDSMHQLVFKRWSNSSKAYILSWKWNTEFVKRRDLKEGDQIGLLWDHYHSRFMFRVLYRINN